MPSLDHSSPYVSLGTECSCLLEGHCDVDVEVDVEGYDVGGVSQRCFRFCFSPPV